MPTTYSVETNFDAIRQAPVSWNTIDLAQLEVPGTMSSAELIIILIPFLLMSMLLRIIFVTEALKIKVTPINY